jgi:hypothetical protein
MISENMRTLTPQHVASISAMTDPSARNLLITEGYFSLGQALAAWIGAGGNWCAFAGWASRQAGRSIRGEDLARHLSRRLGEHSELQSTLLELMTALGLDRAPLLDAIASAILRTPSARRSSEAVARGNLKVFCEIGHVIARMLEAMGTGGLSESEVRAFCESLPPGPPPDGQDLLREALVFYARAQVAETAKSRAEWVLFGNLKIGFHEQTRLQPEVSESIESAVLPQPELEKAIWDALWELRPIGQDLFAIRKSVRMRLIQRVASQALQLVRTVITRRLMTIELAGGQILRLGEDHARPYPETLQTLENSDLAAFWASIGDSDEAGQRSGAADWADFPDRMHFIVELFRRYQDDATLMIPPEGGYR